MKIIIQNQMSEICRINDVIDAIAEPWGLSCRMAAQLSLVLDELLSNIILYAYLDKDHHNIEINLEIKDNRLHIEVKDDGIEFNPLLYPEPDLNPNLAKRKVGGLGIHIIRKMTHEFSYIRKNGYNYQRFSKLLDPKE